MLHLIDKKLNNQLISHVSLFPLSYIALLLLIDSLYNSHFIMSCLATIFLASIFLRKWLLIKNEGKKNLTQKILLFFEGLILFFNFLIIFMLVQNFLDDKEDLEYQVLKLSFCQFIFLLVYENNRTKMFSSIIFSITFILMVNLKTKAIILICLTNFIFFLFLYGQNFNQVRRKTPNFKSLSLKNTAMDLSTELINTILLDSSDCILVLDVENQKVVYCCSIFSDIFKVDLHSYKEMMNSSLFKDSTFFLLREIKGIFTDNVILNEIFLKLNENMENEDKATYYLSELILQLQNEKSTEAIYSIWGSFPGNENKDLFLLLKKNRLITIKLKTDFVFKSWKSLRINFENQTKAISFLAHEFRTPLNCIVNMLQLLENLIDDDAHVKNYIYPAVASSLFLLNLVNDLLDIAQIQAGTFKIVPIEFDLSILFDDVINLISIQAENRGLKLNLKFDQKINCEIVNDPNRVRQVITNLLSTNFYIISIHFLFKTIGNALKYTTKGSITLAADSVKNSNNTIRITVSDTGLGIKPEDQKKLFKAFGKITDQTNLLLNSQGVGLGLMISNKLAMQLSEFSGGIQVQSEYGQGSKFSFCVHNMSDNQENVTESMHDEILSPSALEYRMIHHFNSHAGGRNLISMHSDLLGFKKTGSMESKRNTGRSFGTEKNKQHSSNNSQQTYTHIPLHFLSKNNCGNSFVFKRSGNTICGGREFNVGGGHSFERDYSMDKPIEAIRNAIKKRGCCCPLALVIDDNDFNILAIRSQLNRFGMNSECALDCESAFEKINSMDNNKCCRFYKFIFLDIEMPIKDGFQVFEEIEKFYYEKKFDTLNVIAVTAHCESSDTILKIKNTNMKDYLIKPLSIETLVIKLDKILTQTGYKF